jgi:protein TonB
MYANRYHSTASRPAGAGGALLISGAMILGLYYAGPKIAPGVFREPPIVIKNIPIEQPIEPQPKPADPAPPVATRPIHRTEPIVPLPPTGPILGTTTELGPAPMDPPGPIGPIGPASGGTVVDPPRPPVMVGPSVDPRYEALLQPPYPPAAIRRGTEGNVTARVLIGADGRVKAIDIVKSPSDDLSEATRKQALARWRFKPATRDGVPVEGWKTMTLRFQIVE